MIILGELKRVGKRQKEKEKEAQEENKKTAQTGAREGAASPRCADRSQKRGARGVCGGGGGHQEAPSKHPPAKKPGYSFSQFDVLKAYLLL